MDYPMSKTELLYTKSDPVDHLPTNSAINLFIDEQKKAAVEVQKSAKKIELAVNHIYEHLSCSSSGRLIYVGAGTSGRIGVQDGSELYPTFNWPLNRFDYMLAGGYEALTKSIERAEDDIIEAKKIFQLKKIQKYRKAGTCRTRSSVE